MRDARASEEDSPSVAPGGALAELLEVERRIEGEVEAARAEAARAVESARGAAEALASESEGSLAGAIDALRRSLDAQTDARIAALEGEARAEVERLQRVDEPTLRRLARRLAARIVAGGAP